VNLLVDTGVFSAAIHSRRRPEFEPLVGLLPGNHVFLAVQTVAELRYGALVAGWGSQRVEKLESAIRATTVVPVTDSLVRSVARLRFECRQRGLGIFHATHHHDLWIAATAIHIGARLVTTDSVFSGVPGLALA
jgi:predicted nucleic acid-binding protein